MSDYSDWLDENLGAYIRYELQLAPDVAQSYVAAGLVGSTAEAEPELVDLPFADVDDGDLQEAVTGEKITPPGTDAAVADEVNDLAVYMTEEEKAAFADLSPEQVAEALALAKKGLADDVLHEADGEPAVAPGATAGDAGGTKPELADVSTPSDAPAELIEERAVVASLLQ